MKAQIVYKKLKINIIIYVKDIVIINPKRINLIRMIEENMKCMGIWKIKINLLTNYINIRKTKNNKQ
jgi:hypothetical protein